VGCVCVWGGGGHTLEQNARDVLLLSDWVILIRLVCGLGSRRETLYRSFVRPCAISKRSTVDPDPNSTNTHPPASSTGQWVWVPDPVDVFVPAKKISESKGQTQVELKSGESKVFKSSECKFNRPCLCLPLSLRRRLRVWWALLPSTCPLTYATRIHALLRTHNHVQTVFPDHNPTILITF
jgi:hypothetical protein